VWSATQTLGLTSSPRAAAAARTLAVAVAVVTAGGFALPPLAILVGLI
jgi:succinate dehydrogenase / fumarate reductase cytochrome b subunit